ncbi:MAG TPA: M28 family peptidase [Bacteroidia bacterium]|nr:M28 family peptidase [Bacteroidia bacterium]
MRHGCLLFGFVFSMHLLAQDTTYARKVIGFLTSEKCYGRGYLKNGLNHAADYISEELKKQRVTSLFASGYFQPFTLNVNTFPGKVSVKINKRRLQPGVDYIMNPESASLRGKFDLEKKDSITYFSHNKSTPLKITLKRKLTFSVASESATYCGIQLLNKNNFNDLKTAEVNIRSTVVKDFQCKNICGFINGTENNDSLIVFSAHYDHLGGLGKKTFFPGANDNASGVSVLLNLAAHYSKNPPRYKTLFIFFAGEEAGLIGSHFFVESKAVDLKKIKFLLNLDLLGTGDDGIMVVNGAIHEKQFALLNQVNSEQQLVKEIKKRGKAQNSDHYWFSEAGVPCFFIYTLGGVTSYHDVFDIEKTLPLTDYTDVCRLILEFTKRL